MKISRWKCRHVRNDRIKNEDIRDKIEAAVLKDKVKKIG